MAAAPDDTRSRDRTAKERMQRYRQRQREALGTRRVTISLDDDTLSRYVTAGLIRAERTESDRDLATAVEDLHLLLSQPQMLKVIQIGVAMWAQELTATDDDLP